MTALASEKQHEAAGEPLERLVASLRERGQFGHAVDDPVVHETHISMVLLVGPFAYKFKRPVDLGFLDFSTLERRRHFCEEELRLNRRTAPGLYLEVVRVTGSVDAPRIGGRGSVIEYAVKMRRFADADRFDHRLAAATLEAADIDRLADTVARLHAAAEVRRPARPVDDACSPALDNFTALSGRVGFLRPDSSSALDRLHEWTCEEGERLATEFEHRVRAGRVRDVHGDLHLANVVEWNGQICLFDCIEFDASLRTVDVISDACFAEMDLMHRGRPGLARRFLDRYLEQSGDFDGLRVHRFYYVYRALVRAKIAALSAGRTRLDCDGYVHTAAEGSARPATPGLLLTVGLSGSGKTRFSARVVEATPAIRVRSDVERKRLRGLAPDQSSASALNAGAYSESTNVAVYEHLERVATTIIESGYHAVVDATFLRRRDRDRLLAIAERFAAPWRILHTVADPETLARRVVERRADASEADLEVLAHQQARFEPLGDRERSRTIEIDTTRPASERAALALVEAFLEAGDRPASN